MPIVDLVGHEPTIPFGRRILSALRMLSATDRYNKAPSQDRTGSNCLSGSDAANTP